ncbi:inorganic pyrophosphatase-like [Antedon mediterranea]|uniref:inorganic pyrophosphatase-like n=1 Tax=Antedon mediterranea TaxID=105859 RepID=UPI003AF4EF7C
MSPPLLIRAGLRGVNPAVRLLITGSHLKQPNMSTYSTVEKGAPNSSDYSIYFRNSNGSYISPFHDIPVYANKGQSNLHMVVEIPRWTNAKMEIGTKLDMNPIKQDIKKNKLRYVKNVFPYQGYIWNYGAIPQTWEDPSHTDPDTNCAGDNDPLDVCEIGQRVAKRGEVIQIKVLGTMALIDEGETDWKILAIDVRDPLSDKLDDVDDIERLMPGFLRATHDWFKLYKIPDGKPANKFAFNGEPKNAEFASKVVKTCHDQWKKLMQGTTEPKGIKCQNTTVAGSVHTIPAAMAQDQVEKQTFQAESEDLPADMDKWHFVKNE